MTPTPPNNSGDSTPNPRFISQAKTTEDILSVQTIGLVNLLDFRKRRAEAIERKEQDAQDAILNGISGRGTPNTGGSGTSTPRDNGEKEIRKKKKRKVVGTPKLSFGGDNDEEGEEHGADDQSRDLDVRSTDTSAKATPTSSRAATPEISGPQWKKKMGVNASVGIVPKALTKSALLREAQTRESLRKEFLQIQEIVKATEINIPFVFYDGTNIPGGLCRIKKGDYVWVFLDRSRKVGADLGVGEKVNSRREWARIGVDDLMMVRGNIIIPHHYDFYYFIINNTRGPGNRLLFDYSSEPPSTRDTTNTPTSSQNMDNYNPLSRPSKVQPKVVDPSELEGTDDDPTYTKVVDRRWYERNKHIFPASVWQEFDAEKDYQNEVKRDQGGNAFFFS